MSTPDGVHRLLLIAPHGHIPVWADDPETFRAKVSAHIRDHGKLRGHRVSTLAEYNRRTHSPAVGLAMARVAESWHDPHPD